MQLIEDKGTRQRLWNRKALNTRWGVSLIFPKTSEDVALKEMLLTVSYDTMVNVYKVLGFGTVNSIPDVCGCSAEETELKYADDRLEYRPGKLCSACTVNKDSRKSVVKALRLPSFYAKADIILFERLV